MTTLDERKKAIAGFQRRHEEITAEIIRAMAPPQDNPDRALLLEAAFIARKVYDADLTDFIAKQEGSEA